MSLNFNNISDFSSICEAYLSMLQPINESCEELTALKHRIDGMTQKNIADSFNEYEFPHKEKRQALMESGAFTRFLSRGSSRSAFLTKDNTVFKIADDERGLAQNTSEAYNASEKNRCGCFAKVLWVSRNRFALEMEYAEMLEGSDLEFEEITGINLDKYFDYLKYEKYVNMTPKKRDVVYRAHFSRNKEHITADLEWLKENHDEIAVELRSYNDEAKRVLINLAKYLATHNSNADFSFRDIKSASNWGKVVRNGVEVCVVLDHGASERVLNHVYNDFDTTGMHSYMR